MDITWCKYVYMWPWQYWCWWLNLNTCRKHEEAIAYHKKALALQPKNASTFSSIGYNYLLMLDFSKAVEYCHKALSIRKNDSFTNEMLRVAIDELVSDLSASVQGKCLLLWNDVSLLCIRHTLGVSSWHHTDELKECVRADI